MTKKEIIELYLEDLNNLVPDSDAKRSRIIDLEDELEALSQHNVVGRSEQLSTFLQWFIDNESKIEGEPEIKDFVKLYLESR